MNAKKKVGSPKKPIKNVFPQASGRKETKMPMHEKKSKQKFSKQNLHFYLDEEE